MTTRREVAQAGHTGDVGTARAALRDADPAIRATALGALHRIGALTATEVGAAVEDESPVVRRRAAEVVAAGGASVSLLPLLADPDPTVIEVAAWACGEIERPEPGAVAALIELATGDEDALVREAAVAALGAIGDQTALPAILQATSDKATVRRRAVLALAPFDGPEVEAALQRALGDRDWQVRQAAEDLLVPPD